jgi:putative membrane protein
MNALSTATVAATALLAAGAALATTPTQRQMPSQAHADPTALSSPYQRQAQDAATPTAFAASAAQDGMSEVALGGLALRKSSNDQVKQLAQKMVQDYGQANQELESIVKSEGLILPTRLGAQYDATEKLLSAKSGAAFDKAYIEHVAKDNAQAVALFESASRSSDPQLAAFARKTLPTLQEHQPLASSLRASTGIRTASARDVRP